MNIFHVYMTYYNTYAQCSRERKADLLNISLPICTFFTFFRFLSFCVRVYYPWDSGFYAYEAYIAIYD